MLFAVPVVTTLALSGGLRADPATADDAAFAPAAGRQGSLVPGLNKLSATLERPLFSPSRRPPPPPPPVVPQVIAPPPAPPPAPPTVSLLGTVLSSDGAKAFALIRVPETNKTRRVSIGDQIESWKIAEIAARQIVLSLDDRSATIKLLSDQPEAKTALGNMQMMPRGFEPPGSLNMRGRRFNPPQP